MDLQRGTFQVNVSPSQRQQLALPQSASHSQHDERFEPFATRSIDERHHLFGVKCPHLMALHTRRRYCIGWISNQDAPTHALLEGPV